MRGAPLFVGLQLTISICADFRMKFCDMQSSTSIDQPQILLHAFYGNLMRWSIIVSVCAIPSFIIAFKVYSVTAMVMGIVMLIAFYSFVASTKIWRASANNWQSVMSALSIAFKLKIFLALIWLPAFLFTKEIHFFVLLPDLYAGIIAHESIMYFLKISGDETTLFLPTLLTTLLQGLIVSLLVVLFAFFVVFPFSCLIRSTWRGR
ncbi:hypothetical protein [Lentilitoribacter sp. Alg239-R112]|uniref:hypothetical protein n=1 Tax=Lentilitoribacter sp. Alg239-R112 TaxID=2305987 RepID=UPI0013A7062D|nr:hypothetical protein [Lentilitoribacter sp. Alg239-R112]